MNYGKSGAVRPGRNEPRHQERAPKGKTPPPDGRPTRAELLARLKAAATAATKPA
ncbi:MAG: hypothetical protein ACKVPY_17920 [Paracoccaceae bacterium]